MANIADNLSRLLGTTGNNIQEILENADSLGSLPLIEFVQESSDTGEVMISVGEVRGIDDVTKYNGLCIVRYTDTELGISNDTFANAFSLPSQSQTIYTCLSRVSSLKVWYMVFTCLSENGNAAVTVDMYTSGVTKVNS